MGRRRSGRRRRSSHGERGGTENKSTNRKDSATGLTGSAQTVWADSVFGEEEKSVQDSPGAGNCEDVVRAEWVEAHLSDSDSHTLSLGFSGGPDMDEEGVVRLTESPESKRRSIKVSHSQKVFPKRVFLEPETPQHEDVFNKETASGGSRWARLDDRARVEGPSVKSSLPKGKVADRINLFERGATNAVSSSTNLRRLDISPARKMPSHLKDFTVQAGARSSSAPPKQSVKERARNFNTGGTDEKIPLPSGHTVNEGALKKAARFDKSTTGGPKFKSKPHLNIDQRDSKSHDATQTKPAQPESKTDSSIGNKDADNESCSQETVLMSTDEVKLTTRTGTRSKKRRNKDTGQPQSPISQNKQDTGEQNNKNNPESDTASKPLLNMKHLTKSTSAKEEEEIASKRPKVPVKLEKAAEIMQSTKKTFDLKSPHVDTRDLKEMKSTDLKEQTDASGFETQVGTTASDGHPPTSRSRNERTEVTDTEPKTEKQQNNGNKKQPVEESSEEGGLRNRDMIVNTLFGESGKSDPSGTKEKKPSSPEDLKEASAKDSFEPAKCRVAASRNDAMRNRESETDMLDLPEKDTITCLPKEKNTSENLPKSDKSQTPSKAKDALIEPSNEKQQKDNATETTATHKRCNEVNTSKPTEQKADGGIKSKTTKQGKSKDSSAARPNDARQEDTTIVEIQNTETNSSNVVLGQIEKEKDTSTCRALAKPTDLSKTTYQNQLDSIISAQITATEGEGVVESQCGSKDAQKTSSKRDLQKQKEKPNTESEEGTADKTKNKPACTEKTFIVNGDMHSVETEDQLSASPEQSEGKLPYSSNENTVMPPNDGSSTANGASTKQVTEKCTSNSAWSSLNDNTSLPSDSANIKTSPLGTTSSIDKTTRQKSTPNDENRSPQASTNETISTSSTLTNEKTIPSSADINKPSQASANEENKIPLETTNKNTSNEKTTSLPASANETSSTYPAPSNEKTQSTSATESGVKSKLNSANDTTTPSQASTNEQATPPPASTKENTTPPPTITINKTTPLPALTNETSTASQVSTKEKTTPPPVPTNEKTTPPPVPTNEKTTPPPVSTNEKTTPPPVPTNEKTTPPPVSTNEKTTPPPVSTNEKTAPPPASTNEKNTPPSVSANEKTTPPPVSTNEKTTSPSVSNNEKTTPPPASTNERTTSPPILTNEKTTPPSVSINQKTTPPPVSTNQKTTPPPVLTNEITIPPPASTNEKTAPPPVSTNEKTTPPSVSTNEKTTPPTVSTNENTTPPPVLTNEKTTPPPASTNKKTTPSQVSINEKATPPPALTNEKATPPPASTNENTTPPPASTNEKTTPPPASTNENTTPPPASTNEKTTPPPASTNEKTTPSQVSINEKATPPSASTNEKTTPLQDSTNEKTTPSQVSVNEKATPPSASTKEKIMPPSVLTNEKATPPPSSANENTPPPPASTNEKTASILASVSKKSKPAPTSTKEKTISPSASTNEKTSPSLSSTTESKSTLLDVIHEKTTTLSVLTNETTTSPLDKASRNTTKVETEETKSSPTPVDEKPTPAKSSAKENAAPSPVTNPPFSNDMTNNNEKTMPLPASSSIPLVSTKMGNTAPPPLSKGKILSLADHDNEKTPLSVPSVTEKTIPFQSLGKEKISHTLASGSEKSQSPASKSTDPATRKKEFISKPFILPQIPFAPGRSSVHRDSPSSWLDVDLPLRKKQLLPEPKHKLSSSVSKTNLDTSGEFDSDDFIANVKRLAMPFSLPRRKHNKHRLQAPPFAMPAIREDHFEKPFDPEEFQHGLKRRRGFILDVAPDSVTKNPDAEVKNVEIKPKRESILTRSLIFQRNRKESDKEEEEKDEGSNEITTEPQTRSRLERCSIVSMLRSPSKARRTEFLSPTESTSNGLLSPSDASGSLTPIQSQLTPTTETPEQNAVEQALGCKDYLSTQPASHDSLKPSKDVGIKTTSRDSSAIAITDINTFPAPSGTQTTSQVALKSTNTDRLLKMPDSKTSLADSTVTILTDSDASCNQSGPQAVQKPTKRDTPAMTPGSKTTSGDPNLTVLADRSDSSPPSVSHPISQVVLEPTKNDGLSMESKKPNINDTPVLIPAPKTVSGYTKDSLHSSSQSALKATKDHGPTLTPELKRADPPVTMLSDTNSPLLNSIQTSSNVVLQPDGPTLSIDQKTTPAVPSVTTAENASAPPPLPSFDDIKLPSYLDTFLPKEPGKDLPSNKINSLAAKESASIPGVVDLKKSDVADRKISEVPPAPQVPQIPQAAPQRELPNIPTSRGIHRRPGKIVIFEHHQFNGQSFEFYRDQPDATHMPLSTVISIKVVRGCWILYEKPGFEGRSIPLEEEGIIELPNQWAEEGEEISAPVVIGSIRLAVKDYATPRIELFTEPAGRGRSSEFVDHAEEVSSFGLPQSTGSIKVHSGLWLVYSDPGFQGLLAVLEAGEYPFPEDWGFPAPAVGSLRPLRMGCLKVEKPNAVKAVLYEKAGFKGRCVEVQGDLFSCTETDTNNSENHGLNGVESLKILGGLWVGYEHEGFDGQQFILEEGEYLDWSDWCGTSQKLLSLRPLLMDSSPPHVKMFSELDFSERGVSIDLLEPLENFANTHYGTQTRSIEVLAGVWLAFEAPGFSGQQYVLEKGLYGAPEDWGASDSRICSVIPVMVLSFVSLLFQERVESCCHFQMELFSECDCRGASVLLQDSLPIMPQGFSARSCRVLSGSWQVFAAQSFSGVQCVLDEGVYPDLRTMGFMQLHTAVQSLQPTGHEFSVPSVVLFERCGLRGRRTLLKCSSVNLQLTDSCTRVCSVLVEGGMWVLYEANNFRGSQILLKPGAIPDWHKFSSWQRIGSLRPLIQKQMYFRLRNKESGLLMTVTGSPEDVKLMRIQVTEEAGGDNQIWSYQDGHLQCKCVLDCVVDSASAVLLSGCRVVLSSDVSRPQQLWNITSDGFIRNNSSPQHVLEVKGGQQFDKNQIILNEFHPNKASQQWSVEIL
nr:mucin-5AC [Danio rerio]|eukprot:XP_021330865.1 mucin-5AC [Danio rerio]